MRTVEIHRCEDGNWREREDRRTGRVRVAKSVVVRWVVVVNGNAEEDFDRLRDARSRYPDAPVIRDPYHTS